MMLWKQNFRFKSFCIKAIAAFRRLLTYRKNAIKPAPGDRLISILERPPIIACAMHSVDAETLPINGIEALFPIVNSCMAIATRIEKRIPSNPAKRTEEYLLFLRSIKHETASLHDKPISNFKCDDVL